MCSSWWSVLVWVLLLCQTVRLQSDDPRRGTEAEEYDSQTLELLPYFDRNATLLTNMTVQIGTDVSMPCRVNRLGDKTVSWMKFDEKGNPQLLTVGPENYAPNNGFSLQFEQPNNWQLRLKSVQPVSSGSYQCQTSTHPTKILRYTLNVVAPTVEIVDDGDKPLKDKIFKTDSTLELRCIVRQVGPGISQHVSWYHGSGSTSRLMNNDTYRGGISVKSEVRHDFGVSKLYVANVNRNDSGLYTCSMGRFGKATVFVSVLNGETPAAMQHGRGSDLPVSMLGSLFTPSILILFSC